MRIEVVQDLTLQRLGYRHNVTTTACCWVQTCRWAILGSSGCGLVVRQKMYVTNADAKGMQARGFC